ncbi:response regulator transcription factor [Granulicella sp. L60]|uniref:response regulator transcription factor n=1 Tax=Granulicella sp. L60 TaxID=1641866 RepID=UPI00131C09CC|nr:response regulator [Granulicella sp. L60]
MQRGSAIALVDDNRLVLHSLAAVLQDAGFIVHDFECPTSLLQSNVLHCLDCIVTDMDMPGMNGCELQAHASIICPLVPVVFLTGSTDERARQNALQRGALAFLSKPTRTADLIDVVTSAVALHRSLKDAFPSDLREPGMPADRSERQDAAYLLHAVAGS